MLRNHVGPLILGAAVGAMLALPACVGRGGPDLPPNIGLTHRSEGGSSRERASELSAEPVPVGTVVWSNFRNTGFFFYGVVVERREDQHRVVYADGASEWVGADALRPDALGEEAEVHVRAQVDGEYASAQVGRRLGEALYVHRHGGEDGWTALPHVRFARTADGSPAPDATPTPPPAVVAPAVGSRVLVNYQSQRLLFAGVVTAEDEQGRLHVVYLDGESAWVDRSLVQADDLREGDEVHVRRTWEPPEWVPGRVRRRVAHAFEVELRDGGRTWTSLFRIRAPVRRSGSGDSGSAGAEGPDSEPGEPGSDEPDGEPQEE